MSDDDLEYTMLYNPGCFFNHPFTDTCLADNCKDDPDEEDEEEYLGETQDDRDLFDLDELQELLESEPDND